MINKIVEKFQNDDTKVAVLYAVYLMITAVIIYTVSEKAGQFVMGKLTKLVKKEDELL